MLTTSTNFSLSTNSSLFTVALKVIGFFYSLKAYRRLDEAKVADLSASSTSFLIAR